MNQSAPTPSGPAAPVLPYATPYGVPMQQAPLYWQGRTLIMPKNTTLPPVCVKCNAPADGPPLKRSMVWHNQLLYLLILFPGLLIYIIVALCVQKRGTIYIGLCARHRAQRRNAIITAWSCVLGSIGLFVLAGVLESGYPVIPAIVMLLFGIIWGMYRSRLVYPAMIDDHAVHLNGVCPQYLQPN